MAIQRTVFPLFLGILLFTGTSFSAGEDAPVVDSPRIGPAHAPGRYYTVLGDRDRHSLDGRWRFRLDREQCDEEEGWFTRTLEGRFSSVPGAWQYVFDDLHETTGVGWYQREFKLDAQLRGRRIAVVFMGVNYRARVWVNGQLAGSHEGGQLPFSLEITHLVRWDRPNQLTVRAEDPATQLDLPVGPAYVEMHRASGIWRSVWLETTPKTFLSDVYVTPDVDHQRVHVQVTVNAPPRQQVQPAMLRLVASRPDGRLHEIRHQVRLPAHPVAHAVTVDMALAVEEPWLWTPQTPHLYVMNVELSGAAARRDTVSLHFGMRKIDLLGTKIRLNNRPIFLRGVNDWQDTPDKNQYLSPYRPRSDEDFRQEVLRIKQMGFNAVRKACYIEDHRFLDWADRLGLLVYGEPPYTWLITEDSIRRWRDQLAGWVHRDRSHPSLIFWGLYNATAGLAPMPYPFGGSEVIRGLTPSPGEQQEMVTAARTLVRSLDRTRPIIDTNGGPAFSTDINAAMHYGFSGPQFHARSRATYRGLRASGRPFLIGEVGGYLFYPDLDKFRRQWGGQEPLPIVRDAGRGWGDTRPMGAGYADRFAAWGLDEVYGSLAGLARQHDWSAFYDLKDEMEQIRMNPDLSGYMITDLANIGPFVHGLLDYDLSLRPFHERLAGFQTADQLLVDRSVWNYWSGQPCTARLILSHYSSNPIESAVVKWRLESTGVPFTPAVEGRIGGVHAQDPGVLQLGEIALTAPRVDRALKAVLHVELWAGDTRRAHNAVDYWIYPRSLERPRQSRHVNVVDLEIQRPCAIGDSTGRVRLPRVAVRKGDRINFLLDPIDHGGGDTLSLSARIIQQEAPHEVWDVAAEWTTNASQNSETSIWSKRWCEKLNAGGKQRGPYELLTRGSFYDTLWNLGAVPPRFWVVEQDRGPFTWKNETSGDVGIAGVGGVVVAPGTVVWNPVNIGNRLYMAIHSWRSPIDGHVAIEFEAAMLQASGDGVRFWIEKNGPQQTLTTLRLPSLVSLPGHRVHRGIDPKLSVTVANEFGADVRQHVAQGGTALLCVSRHDQLPDQLGLTVGTAGYGLGGGLQASAYINPVHGLFQQIPYENPLGWTFAKVLQPFQVIGGLRSSSRDDVLVGGYSEWLRSRVKASQRSVVGELTGLVVQFRYGRGRLVITTLDLPSHLATDPVAAIVFHNLLEYCHTDFRPGTELPLPVADVPDP